MDMDGEMTPLNTYSLMVEVIKGTIGDLWGCYMLGLFWGLYRG